MNIKVIHIPATEFDIENMDCYLQYFNSKCLPEFCAAHSVQTGPIWEPNNILDLMSKDLAAGWTT